MGKMTQRITFADVFAANPEHIFYSTKTCWWTHDPKDLQKGAVPLDICGAPLFQADRDDPFKHQDGVAAFLDAKVIRNHSAYSPEKGDHHHVTVLMAMHHQNCKDVPDFVRKAKAADYAEYINLAVMMGDWKPEPEDKEPV